MNKYLLISNETKNGGLYFDGGGGSGNYNTTRKYDTLETLAKEWNEANDTYEIVINEKSLNGNRSSITSMLEAGTAPDMLMQVGSVVNDDIGYGWYVPLNEYLEQPNPYQEGNTAWKEIYGTEAVSASQASDGKNYYVCLDNIAIGMMYNMDLLQQAGVNAAPTTHSEFVQCLEKLAQAKVAGTISAEVYCPSGLWHENYIGNSIYGDIMQTWDTDRSGSISTKELVDAYKANEWNIDDARFKEFLRLLGEKSKYYGMKKFKERGLSLYEVAKSHDDGEKRVWITEIGITEASVGTVGTKKAQDTMANYSMKMLDIVEEDMPFVETCFWFRYSNCYSRYVSEGENNFGIFYSPDDPVNRAKPKPIALALYRRIHGENADVSPLYWYSDKYSVER